MPDVPDPYAPPTTSVAAEPVPARGPLHQQRQFKIGTVVMTIGLLAGTEGVTGFGRFFTLDLSQGLAVGVLSGIVGMSIALWRHAPLPLGIISGAVAGVGSFLTGYFWMQGRTSVWNYEELAALAVGALPGILLATWWLKTRAQAETRP